MRRLACAVVAVLLAGCSSPGEDAPSDPLPTAPFDLEPFLRDNLTAHLHPASGPFFPTMWIEDVVEFPQGGNITLATGLGMRCEGNATLVAPNATGLVTCSLRLAADPTALVESRRQLDLGFDYQPLTQRTPTEAVEWRVVVEAIASDVERLDVVFDSGWRAVDMAPRISTPVLKLEVYSPCDAPDEVESDPIPGHFGWALLNVSFTVLSHAQVSVVIGLADSVADAIPDARPVPEDGNVTPHRTETTFPEWADERAMWLLLPVDLETHASPGLVGANGECDASVAYEEQVWSVDVTYVGADGEGDTLHFDVPVGIYLAPPTSP